MSYERRLGTETPCDRGAVKAIESVHDTGTPSMADGQCGSSALCYFYLCGLPHPALGFKVTLQDFRLKGYFSTTADSYRTCKLPAFVFRCDLDHLPDPDGYVNRCFLVYRRVVSTNHVFAYLIRYACKATEADSRGFMVLQAYLDGAWFYSVVRSVIRLVRVHFWGSVFTHNK